MKSTTVRIIVWAVVAVMLLGLLIAGLRWSPLQDMLGLIRGNGDGWWVDWGNDVSIHSDYENSSRYTVGGGSVLGTEIDSIDIDWVSDEVNIIPVDGDTIRFSETGSDGLDDAYKMHYLIDNGTLHIRYCRSGFSIRRLLHKELTVELPRTLLLDDCSVETASAALNIQGVNANELDLDVVSGALSVRDVIAETVDVDAVSGQIELDNIEADTFRLTGVSGHVEITNSRLIDASCDLVSGGILIAPGEVVQQLDIETVSGPIRVRLPESVGFTANYSDGIGGFTCDFPVEFPSRRVAVYNGGGAEFDFSSISSSIRIEHE